MPQLKNTLLLLFIVSLCFPLNLLSQDNKIKGTIKNNEGTVVEFASVALFLNNTSFVKSAISDGQGRFSMKEVTPGSYTIRIDFLGYETYVSDNFSIKATQTLQLPPPLLY